MEFKDYYAALGVAPTATQDEIKRSYRKLARKYHPDVSQEPDAESRFKDVAEAHEALIDPERRAAYDDIVRRHAEGPAFASAPGWDSGYEFSGRGAPGASRDDAEFSDFFASLFGSRGRAGQAHAQAQGGGQARGQDHHAKVTIALEDAYRGATQMITLRVPVIDAEGRGLLQERQLEVHIPKGVREGQSLRLTGQGGPGLNGASAGDLYLEIRIEPQPRFRVDGADVYVDLPVSPWEAALGASVNAPTPEGEVQLTVPAGSSQGRKLRLKGKGLPGKQPGDLYAVLGIVLPKPDSSDAQSAYAAFAKAFPDFNPRTRSEA